MPIADRGSDIYSAIRTETRLTAVSLAGTVRVLYFDEADAGVAEFVETLGAARKWEITHATSRAEAAAIASKQPVDVAVIAGSLADIDSIDLAGEIGRFHPKLTVFILSGETDNKAARACSSGRYQWMDKPCDPVALISSIERMASLVSWLTNNTTLELVSDIHCLPAIPSNYQGVIRIIHSPTASIQEIGDAINRDMGMTSRVLQVANSAYYGYSKKITSPTEAILFLGVETVKSLIHYSHLLNNFPQLSSADVLFDRVWKHSMGVAAVARKITLLETRNETLAEEAFTAGLLHDIGKLVLMSMRAQEYREVIRQAAARKGAPHMIERLKLGTTHAEAGAYLLSLWGIPYSILEAVAWHHYPDEAMDRKFSPLTAVHVANVFERVRQDPENARYAPQLDYRYLAEVGVTERIEEWRKCLPDLPMAKQDPDLLPYIVQAGARPAPLPESHKWRWLILGAVATSALVAWLFAR